MQRVLLRATQSSLRSLGQNGIFRASIFRGFGSGTGKESKIQNEQKVVTQDVEGSDKDFRPQDKIPKGENADAQLLSEIEGWVKQNKVCLFMKGSPQMPMCGYSKLAVEILKHYSVKDYKSVDVLKDANVRRLVKEYSNWPTFPQLYVNGELVGGADILTEMHKQGSLKEVLSK